jgi:hypothetical protein
MSESVKNPAEYGYLGDEIISVPVKEYWKLKELVDATLMEETKQYFEEKYMWVSPDGQKVEKLTEKNKPTSKRIVNVEGTLNSDAKILRTPKGLDMLALKLSLNQVHLNMIEAGVAKHIPTLQAEMEAQKNDAPDGKVIPLSQ